MILAQIIPALLICQGIWTVGSEILVFVAEDISSIRKTL
jgi:hypothetical protein